MNRKALKPVLNKINAEIENLGVVHWDKEFIPHNDSVIHHHCEEVWKKLDKFLAKKLGLRFWVGAFDAQEMVIYLAKKKLTKTQLQKFEDLTGLYCDIENCHDDDILDVLVESIDEKQLTLGDLPPKWQKEVQEEIEERNLQGV